MSDQIRINYEEVYSRTTQLKSCIEVEISRVMQEYEGIESSLEGLDSATNAFLQVTMRRNQQKTIATAEVLERLLVFIKNSARQIEMREQIWASLFSNNPTMTEE